MIEPITTLEINRTVNEYITGVRHLQPSYNFNHIFIGVIIISFIISLVITYIKYERELQNEGSQDK